MPVALALGDSDACGLELMRFVDAGPVVETDRRRRVRLALALHIRLFRTNGSPPIDSSTKNVSSQGFYCFVSEALAVGEHIRCVLALPSFDPIHRDRLIGLDCHARVVRVESLGPGEYGIGCAIERYQVIQLHKEQISQGSATAH